MVWLVLSAVILLVGTTVFFGPPYVPTLRRQTEVALDLLDLKPGQTLLELGSGDGRVVLAAARRGLNVVGIELSPLLVLISLVRTWRYRKQVKIVWGNYFITRWPEADGIFTFMIQRQMAKLDAHILRWQTHPLRLASYAFTIPGRKPAKHKAGIFLYEYK